MRRIGVFVCWCGSNIAGTVDVEKVVECITLYPEVVYATHYKYFCSDPGQNIIKRAIKDKGLDGIVIAACSPSLHETTFRRTVESVGINPYQCEIANIREQCSWVHTDRLKATGKAIDTIKTVVEKVHFNQSLLPLEVPITKRALVIGGGISGIQTSLDIANSGYEVVIVEQEPSIGGHMAQLSETFPTLDCSQCILTPKMVEVGQHPRIKLLTYCQIEEVNGYVGNFTVKIKRKASYVNWERCNGCGLCQEKCPSKVSSQFERFLGVRKAIYTPFAQAVPNKPVIDRENCLYFQKERCRVCEKFCPLEAIDFKMEDSFIEEKVGAIVVATGYDLYPQEQIMEYNSDSSKDIIDGLQFERLLSASGPTGGEIRRPSDGKTPKEVVFIQCAGSRDPERGLPYCSKICCMYTAKHAMLYKHKVPEGEAYIFYMDIRSGGKGYEEFVQRGVEEDGIFYIRGRVSKIFPEGERIIVWGADTLTGKKVEVAADLVVLALAITPSKGTLELAKKLKISTDKYGFFSEAHPKLRPVESLTRGIYLAGCAQAPKDIPEAVSQASGAASKVLELFSNDRLYHNPLIAEVDIEVCSGCETCVSVCPYNARELDERKRIARVIEVSCQGCGACASACPNGATKLRNFDRKQILTMIDALI